MVFELIILRLLALLLVFLILWWLGTLAWKAFSGNQKFDEFAKTINQQPSCEKNDCCCKSKVEKTECQNNSDKSNV